MVAEQMDKLNKDQTSKLLVGGNFIESNGPKIGKRHIQSLFLLLIVIMNYFIRVSMSVIVVAMTDPTSNPDKKIPIYNWKDKGLVVSSFMWGYMIPQVGAGYLATMYGAKWFLAGSLITSSSLGFLVPLLASYFGSKGVMAVRILQGLGQGFMFPSIHAFLGKWVPVQERSRLGSLPFMGTTLGTVAAMLLSGYLAASSLGWPKTLYIFNGVGVVAGVTFAYLGSSEPDKHPTITEEEKTYIKKNIGRDSNETKDLPVPWFEILTSIKFWAMIIAQTGFSWGTWTLLLQTPIYMSHVMKFDLQSNGVLSSLPYIADALATLPFSTIADYLIVKNICTIGRTRKIMNFIGMIGSAAALILLGHCGSDDSGKAVTLLVIIGLVTAAVKSGFNVNQIDLSPNFAGVLMGISNGVSTAICSLGPLVAHILVKDEDDPHQWKMIFLVSAIFAIGAFIINAIFASGSVQPWNNGSRKIRQQQNQLPIKV